MEAHEAAIRNRRCLNYKNIKRKTKNIDCPFVGVQKQITADFRNTNEKTASRSACDSLVMLFLIS